uniref:Uncharacterized protein n=1 Tax=Cucumis melo TaxID=3656 RepID=A0A9I9E164_CUCME
MECRRRNSSVETCEVNAMENSKVLSNMRNMISSGKHALLPLKSPVPSGSSTYFDCLPNPIIGSRAVQNPRVGNVNHHRTSSESLGLMISSANPKHLFNEMAIDVHQGTPLHT